MRILNCEDAIDSKDTARDINNFDRRRWNEVAEELCYDGIKEKFLQNPSLMETLLNTGNKTLVESSYDDVWGTGVPLSNRNCLVQEQWKSFGILGRILMNIRENAKNEEMQNDNCEESTSTS